MSAAPIAYPVRVDTSNPGQFFACCGLLELAGRLRSGTEGWFDREQSTFTIFAGGDDTLRSVIDALSKCPISGLSGEELDERERLEAEKRALKKRHEELPAQLESRRKELGTIARKGAVELGAPFQLSLNWWQVDDEDPATPKTWAGLQEIHKICRATQDALSGVSNLLHILNYPCVLRKPREYWKKDADRNDKIEPFYFDSRRFANALDTGWSLDEQKVESVAHPAVELLALIGIQRFRPRPATQKRSFEYWTWSRPLGSSVASAVAGGSVASPGREAFRFALRFRDDQKRLKAFGYANRLGGE